jgi:hypothetical protein
MRNTPPRLPIEQRPTDELIEDLCIALREVGCMGPWHPEHNRGQQAISDVKQIYRELSSRSISVDSQINKLSLDTKWQMDVLLGDCLAYPNHIPYVRDVDGIRRSLRCALCAVKERRPDAQVFWYCEECMRVALDALISTTPGDRFFLFKTYNQEQRCVHADNDTLLISDSSYYEQAFGVCQVCIEKEIQRRTQLPPW